MVELVELVGKALLRGVLGELGWMGASGHAAFRRVTSGRLGRLVWLGWSSGKGKVGFVAGVPSFWGNRKEPNPLRFSLFFRISAFICFLFSFCGISTRRK